MEVIIMKKLTVERLIAKLENIGICLMDEQSFVEDKGHTSGMYTTNDLDRIITWVESLIKDTNNIDNNLMKARVQFLCASVVTMSQQIIDFINNEEV